MDPIQLPNTEEIEATSKELVAASASVKVTTQADYEAAAVKFKAAKAFRKHVVDTFTPAKQAAHKAHAEICTAEKKFLDPTDKAILAYGKTIVDFEVEQKRLAAIENNRLLKEAQEKARLEEEELKRKQDDDRLRIAASLERQGFTEDAQKVIEQDLPAPVVNIVVPEPVAFARASGIRQRVTYYGICDDILLLAAEVVAGNQPKCAIMGNPEFLNEQAESLKGEFRIPGCRVVDKKTPY